MSAYDITAREMNLLSAFKEYLDEEIEYIDPILNIQNNIHEVEENIERNHDYTIQPADDINSNLSCEIEELKSEIESLKDMIEDLREG